MSKGIVLIIILFLLMGLMSCISNDYTTQDSESNDIDVFENQKIAKMKITSQTSENFRLEVFINGDGYHNSKLQIVTLLNYTGNVDIECESGPQLGLLTIFDDSNNDVYSIGVNDTLHTYHFKKNDKYIIIHEIDNLTPGNYKVSVKVPPIQIIDDSNSMNKNLIKGFQVDDIELKIIKGY